MFDGDATSVEKDEHNNTPIEWLRLDGSPDAGSDSFLHYPKRFASSLALEPGVDVVGPREALI